MSWLATIACSVSWLGCSNFNARINRLDRVIAVDGTSNFFEPFAVNLTTGALTSQGRVSTTVTPSLVATGRANSVVLLSDGASVLCYRYDTRLGTGPTLESTTTIANLSGMKIAPDDLTFVYLKTGSTSLFWRTLNKCSLGTEQSVSLPGAGANDLLFAIAETGDVVFVVEISGSFVWKVARNSANGSLSGVTAKAASPCPNGTTVPAISPDGRYGFFCTGGGVDLSVINLSTLAINSVTIGTAVDVMIATENLKGVMLGQTVAHQGFVVSSSGVPTVSGSVTFSIPDLRNGAIINPERTFAYVAGPTSTSLWINKISTAAPFVSSVTSSAIGFVPQSFNYLQGYSR